MVGRTGARVRALARPRPGAALARPRPGAALAAVGLAWSVLTVLLSTVLRPADCVEAAGITGFIARNIAQMRMAAECPTGTLGYGPHTMAAVGAASALLASLVIAHAAAGALAYWLGRAAGATRALIAALSRPLPQLLRRWTISARATLLDWRGTAVVPDFPHHPVWRRGPPLPA